MNIALGQLGEKIAVDYLKNNNFKIIKTHFTSHWGEIDIIAQKDSILYFIEVKTRISKKYGSPEEAVHYYKLKSLMRAVNYFLLKNKIHSKMRLSIIAITLNSNLTPEKIKFYNIDSFRLLN